MEYGLSAERRQLFFGPSHRWKSWWKPDHSKGKKGVPTHRALSRSQLRSLITQGWLLCAAYAWHSCKEHSCFSPKLLKVCELFCLQQPHPLCSHGSCCTLLLLKGDFFFYVRYSDTSYGSLIRPERLSDAPTSLTGCCGEDHMPRVIYASVVRNINLALCFITLSAYLTVCDTMKVNQIAAKSAVPLPVYRSTASFSARDQCTS